MKKQVEDHAEVKNTEEIIPESDDEGVVESL